MPSKLFLSNESSNPFTAVGLLALLTKTLTYRKRTHLRVLETLSSPPLYDFGGLKIPFSPQLLPQHPEAVQLVTGWSC